MAIYKTRDGQSLSDIAIEVYGGIEGVFALLEDNLILNNSLDEIPTAGLDLVIREVNPLSAQANFTKLELKRQDYKLGSAPLEQQVPMDYIELDYIDNNYIE